MAGNYNLCNKYEYHISIAKKTRYGRDFVAYCIALIDDTKFHRCAVFAMSASIFFVSRLLFLTLYDL
jgi:hypothetical protein